jgi:hypothetical protein
MYGILNHPLVGTECHSDNVKLISLLIIYNILEWTFVSIETLTEDGVRG